MAPVVILANGARALTKKTVRVYAQTPSTIHPLLHLGACVCVCDLLIFFT